MNMSLLSPLSDATYNLFHVLSGILTVIIFMIVLRDKLTVPRLILLIFLIFTPVTYAAGLFSRFFAGVEGQSFSGVLATQLVVLFVYFKALKLSQGLTQLIFKTFFLTTGLSYMILRISCHFRGCCWGELCALPWAITYKSSNVVTPWLGLPLHPAQLYSAFHGLVMMLVALFLFKKQVLLNYLVASFLVIYSVGRLVTDYFRADAAYYEQSFAGVEPNTFLSLCFLVVGIGFFLRQKLPTFFAGTK